jgi:diguanylate cyclase (GGDEF)-like protein
MKKFINNNPMWVIIVIICFSSVVITLAMVPFTAIVLERPFMEVARPAAILSLLVPLFVGTPIVGYYRKIIGENLEMIERLGKDPLTRLLNRHTFVKQYNDKVNMLTQLKKPVALAMIDIDNFKIINDTYGHLAGDEVIKNVGTKIHKLVREKDLLCRFGGEEFLLVIGDLDQQQVLELGNSILNSLRRTIKYEEQQISYTVSVGLVYYHECRYSSEELIRQADNQMYKAKAEGKNRLACNWDE